MENKSTKPVQYLSANSKNLKNFQLKQKFKVVLFATALVVPLAYGGVWYMNNGEDDGSNVIPIAVNEPDYGVIDDVEFVEQDASQAQGGSPSLSAPAVNESGSRASSPVQGDQPAAAPSNAGALPSGVSVAAGSIESSGIKGNPYVADSIDASMLPEGTGVTFNRSSWQASDANNGTMNASLAANGQVYNGIITFSKIGGSWKATGYSIQ